MQLESPSYQVFSLPVSTLHSKHERLQVNLMVLRETHLSQAVIRIRILAMVPGTKRESGKVRGLLTHSLGTQAVGVGSFDNGQTAADSGADHAS